MKKVLIIFSLLYFTNLSSYAAMGPPAPGQPDAMLANYFPNYSYSDCIACNQNNFQTYYPMNSNNNFSAFNGTYNYPWWGQYGALSYPNYYYPSAWSNNGVNTNYYSGHGGGFAGKPNVYISAPDGVNLLVTVLASKESNLLLTVPAYEGGWKAVVIGDKFIIEDISHDYLFYDIRFDEQSFSAETGFCGNRKTVIEEMMTSLQSLAFKPQEIKDFYDYWSIKLPRSEKYCVFPQFNEENDKAYKLQVSSSDNAQISITRVTFMVTVGDAINEKSKQKFYHRPKNQSAYLKRIKSLGAQPKEKIWVREWAVAFTAGK
jgi:hypothetical protein